jgi:hypothetical protein
MGGFCCAQKPNLAFGRKAESYLPSAFKESGNGQKKALAGQNLIEFSAQGEA